MKSMVMRVLTVCGLACGLTGCAMFRSMPRVPVARAVYTSEPIQIDGVLNEAAWQRATVISNFYIPETYATVVSPTAARVLWDENFLYVAFDASDQDVWGYLKNHDDGTCREDVLEVFVQPDVEQGCYYNFEINALGTCLDGWIPRGKTGLIGRGVLWDCPGVKTGAKVQGTLNDWQDVDTGWQLELAIPFASLPTLNKRPPSPGDVWKIQLSRYDYSVYLPEDGRELSASIPLSKANFHLPGEWGSIRFER